MLPAGAADNSSKLGGPMDRRPFNSPTRNAKARPTRQRKGFENKRLLLEPESAPVTLPGPRKPATGDQRDQIGETDEGVVPPQIFRVYTQLLDQLPTTAA